MKYILPLALITKNIEINTDFLVSMGMKIYRIMISNYFSNNNAPIKHDRKYCTNSIIATIKSKTVRNYE